MMFRDQRRADAPFNLSAHVDQMFGEGRAAGSAAAAVRVPRRGRRAAPGRR